MDGDDVGLPLGFAEERAVFKGPTQNARVLTEGWVADHLFCPNCGEERLCQYGANKAVADFVCATCDEDFELKSQRSRLGAKIPDGALGTMMERLASNRVPNLLLLRYDQRRAAVMDLIVVPKPFFVPSIIEARRPLGPSARRAGWQGCNILIGEVPEAGRIRIVENGAPLPKAEVRARWDRTAYLRRRSLDARGWLLAVLRCVDRLETEFTIDQVYGFEPERADLYPGNRHVREKMRQQLQVLRDAGVLEFVGRGRYRRLAGG